MASFLWAGFNCLKDRATLRKQFTFLPLSSQKFLYSFYQPGKDERLSQPWSYPLVLNTGPLDYESSALTTRPLVTLFLRIYKNKNSLAFIKEQFQ